MLKKFTIEYTNHPHSNEPCGVHRTDDPVEVEEYLAKLLGAGSRIISIKHEGVEVHQVQADRMLKVAGERLVSGLLAHALDVDSAEVRQRFGFAA